MPRPLTKFYFHEFHLWLTYSFILFPTSSDPSCRFRVLYDNVISLVYDTYTSHVKHQVNTKLLYFFLVKRQITRKPIVLWIWNKLFGSIYLYSESGSKSNTRQANKCVW
jgi:hypothetical protein